MFPYRSEDRILPYLRSHRSSTVASQYFSRRKAATAPQRAPQRTVAVSMPALSDSRGYQGCLHSRTAGNTLNSAISNECPVFPRARSTHSIYTAKPREALSSSRTEAPVTTLLTLFSSDNSGCHACFLETHEAHIHAASRRFGVR